MLITTLMLTSCFGGRDDEHNNTLGDDNGDGVIEDGTDDGTGGGKDMVEDIKDGADSLMNNTNGSSGNTGNGSTSGSNGGSGSTNGGNSGSGSTNGGNGGSGSTNGGNGSSGSTNGGNGGSGSMNSGNGGTDTEGGMKQPKFSTDDKVDSANDAVNFIGANVYSMCQDVIPLMTETKILSTDDLESITYNTGLTNTDGIDDIILSESSLDSFAYSFLMIRTDGTNTDELQSQVGQSINPQKWLGVVAEKVASVKLDNDIILVMGGSEQVDTIMNSVVTAANGIYENIGEIISVMG